MFELNGKYTNAMVYADTVEEIAISQIITLCNHPMFKDASIRIMPDCHAGAGCVIGFTAILKQPIVVPNLVGVDIGCGVRTIVFTSDDIDYKSLDDFIRNNIPSGFAVRGKKHPAMSSSIETTVQEICDHINEDADKINRHVLSCGSLGGGNHYIEIGHISDGKYALSIHTGSRNLGKKICEYYQNKATCIDEDLKASILARHKTATTAEEHQQIQNEISNLHKVPKELAFLTGSDYDAYVNDMLLAKDFAAENRRLIALSIMDFLKSNFNADTIEEFDTIHNYIDKMADGNIIIRKGAISAEKNQKVAIPLNMRDGVIIGIGKGNPEWNYSAPHGAGRLMSRSAAKHNLSMADFEKAMNGIQTWSVNTSTIDESPMAYKPAQEIISAVSDTIDIDTIIKPAYNFKASE